MGSLGECGLEGGPYYGKKISVDIKRTKIDETIIIPNGKIYFVNIKNDLPIIIIKIDKSNEVKWAYEFSKEDIEIPFYKISGLELIETKETNYIHFFNNSYGEPGSFYLDNNYDFMYLCLSPM